MRGMIRSLCLHGARANSGASIPLEHSTATPPPQLPTELIMQISSHIIGKDGDTDKQQIRQSLLTMARVCRAWYRAVVACLYTSARPSHFLACKLLARTLENNMELASIVRSLSLPADDDDKTLHLYAMISTTLTARRVRAISELVARCPNLTCLAISMENALWWDAAAIRANFPAMSHGLAAGITHLEISGSPGPWMYPAPKRIIGFWHLATWLGQVPVLPNLECFTLTEIAMASAGTTTTTTTITWPEMPRLQRLKLNHPFWGTTFDERLFLHVQTTLKSLHIFDFYQPYIEGSSIYRPFSDPSYAVTRLLPCLEEFSLVYHVEGTWLPSMPVNELTTSISPNTSLRRLRVSGFLVREKLWTYSRSPLETLVLVVCGTADMIYADYIWEMLPSTVKNVVLEVETPGKCILSEEACLEHMIITSRLNAERLGFDLRVDRKPRPGVKLESKKPYSVSKHIGFWSRNWVNRKRWIL